MSANEMIARMALDARRLREELHRREDELRLLRSVYTNLAASYEAMNRMWQRECKERYGSARLADDLAAKAVMEDCDGIAG